jgi:hypothetical protein
MEQIILSYIAGAVSGGLGGWLYLKKKMKDKAKSLGEDEEFQEMMSGVVEDVTEMMEEDNGSEK